MSNVNLKQQLVSSGLKEDVRALRSEIRKLQSQKAKFEAKNVSLEAELVAARTRIKSLEALKEPVDPMAGLTENEKARRFLFAVNKALSLVGSKNELK